jgi:membrane-bound serine protease (ClpP class)
MHTPIMLYALYVVGLVALLLEASAPGVIIPTIIGLICLTFSVLGFYEAGLSFTGPLFIALAVATYAFTLFQRQFWGWFMLGTTLFLAGTGLYFQQALLWGRTLESNLLGPVLGGAFGLVILGGFALKKLQRLYRHAPAVTTVASRYIGQSARVTVALSGSTLGKVRLMGELWPALLDSPAHPPVAKGATVQVVGYDTLPQKTLRVSATPPSEVESPPGGV